MNTIVSIIIGQYRLINEVLRNNGREELYHRFDKIFSSVGFEHAIEYFVNIGLVSKGEIDALTNHVAQNYTCDRILEGVEPGPDLARDTLAFTYAKMDDFPEDGREAMIELGEIVLDLAHAVGPWPARED